MRSDPARASRPTRATAGHGSAADLREQAEEQKVAEYVRRIADAWPPLTARQRDLLTLLLHPGGTDAP